MPDIFDSALKFDQDHDARGRFASSSEEIIGSPNTSKNQTLTNALAQMRSHQIKGYAGDSTRVDRSFGFAGDKERAVGLWEGSFEGSTIDHVKGRQDEETLIAAACVLGKEHKQDAMAVWMDAKDGPHQLYTMNIPKGMEVTPEMAKREGVFAASFTPQDDGSVNVGIIQTEPDQNAALELAIKLHASDISVRYGKADFPAKADYDDIISKYNAKHPRATKYDHSQDQRFNPKDGGDKRHDYSRRNQAGPGVHHATRQGQRFGVTKQEVNKPERSIQGLKTGARWRP